MGYNHQTYVFNQQLRYTIRLYGDRIGISWDIYVYMTNNVLYVGLFPKLSPLTEIKAGA